MFTSMRESRQCRGIVDFERKAGWSNICLLGLSNMAVISNANEAAWRSSSHLGRLALSSIGVSRALEEVAGDCLKHIFWQAISYRQYTIYLFLLFRSQHPQTQEK